MLNLSLALLVKLAGRLNRDNFMEEIKSVSKQYIDNPTVSERIVKISNEIRVQKAGHNEFTRSGYFQPDDIMKAINPLLSKYSLISLFNMTFSKEKDMYEGVLQIADSTNKVDSGEQTKITYRFDIPMQELKGNAGKAQNAGATQTYCKRYMFMNAFNLADNKADPDAKLVAGKSGIDWEKKMQGAKTGEELKAIFGAMPQAQKVALKDLKDFLKEGFEATSK